MIRLLLGVALGLALSTCWAHAAPPEGSDPDSETAHWYKSLRTPGGGLCCSLADCRPVNARQVGDSYEVYIGRKFPSNNSEADVGWVAVPQEAILNRVENPEGRTVACWTPWAGVICFVRPDET